jgi:hypothetical protein
VREAAVPAVDLDEGLRVAGLEVEHEHTVVQGGITTPDGALRMEPDDHSYPYSK